MTFEDNLNGAADFFAVLSLADSPTYVELSDGSAGVVLEVAVLPTGPATLRILVTAKATSEDSEIQHERKANSPEQDYATAPLSKVTRFKRPPNG